jgi:hypothetical protein
MNRRRPFVFIPVDGAGDNDDRPVVMAAGGKKGDGRQVNLPNLPPAAVAGTGL